MKNEPLVVTHSYNAPPARVWQAITDPAQMRQWYFDVSDFRAEVGFTFEFTGESDDCSYLHVCEVTAVVPGKKITYSWSYPDHPGISFVTWELFEEGNGTRLVLTHSGLETFPPHKDFARSSFTEGWTYFLDNALPKFLEE